MHVGGHSREVAALHLMLATAGMMSGVLFIALFIGSLQRRGIHPDRVLGVAMVAGLVAMLGLVLGTAGSHLAWFVLGTVFAVGNMAYALLSARFPAALAGRANTALNLGVFVGAFVIQWGYGAALDLLGSRGWSPADAHRVAAGSLLAMQAASFAWFLRRGPGATGAGRA